MTTFTASNVWLRDNYICERCKSIPRQRHLQAILDIHFPGWESKLIHESSPSNNFICQYAPNYSSSQYLANVEPGRTVSGIRCENLEHLTFSEASFDLFITQDVLEHVFNPREAVRDIQRTLKPGGAHIFTAPKHKGLTQTRQRASIDGAGNVTYLMEPEYHGNPVGDGRALVTWDYGYDFEQLLSEWASATVAAYHTRDRTKGLDAEFNEVFVIGKTSASSTLGRHR